MGQLFLLVWVVMMESVGLLLLVDYRVDGDLFYGYSENLRRIVKTNCRKYNATDAKHRFGCQCPIDNPKLLMLHKRVSCYSVEKVDIQDNTKLKKKLPLPTSIVHSTKKRTPLTTERSLTKAPIVSQVYTTYETVPDKTTTKATIYNIVTTSSRISAVYRVSSYDTATKTIKMLFITVSCLSCLVFGLIIYVIYLRFRRDHVETDAESQDLSMTRNSFSTTSGNTKLSTANSFERVASFKAFKSTIKHEYPHRQPVKLPHHAQMVGSIPDEDCVASKEYDTPGMIVGQPSTIMEDTDMYSLPKLYAEVNKKI